MIAWPYPESLIAGKVNFAVVKLFAPLHSEVGNCSEVRFVHFGIVRDFA